MLEAVSTKVLKTLWLIEAVLAKAEDVWPLNVFIAKGK